MELMSSYSIFRGQGQSERFRKSFHKQSDFVENLSQKIEIPRFVVAENNKRGLHHIAVCNKTTLEMVVYPRVKNFFREIKKRKPCPTFLLGQGLKKKTKIPLTVAHIRELARGIFIMIKGQEERLLLLHIRCWYSDQRGK